MKCEVDTPKRHLILNCYVLQLRVVRETKADSLVDHDLVDQVVWLLCSVAVKLTREIPSASSLGVDMVKGAEKSVIIYWIVTKHTFHLIIILNI